MARRTPKRPKFVIDLTRKSEIDVPKVARQFRKKNKPQVPGLPPSLSRIPTELDRLYADFGGPVRLMKNADKSMFVQPCNDFPLARVKEILSPYCHDAQRIRQCWPWVAFAADQYRFEQKERKKKSEEPEPTPTKIVETIKTIETSAEALANAIAKLQDLAHRLDDPTAPSRRPHLAYIDELIAQATAGLVPGGAIEDANVAEVVSHFGRLSFLERVACVQAMAHHAKSLISTDLLKRPSAQPEDVALINLADRIGRIWIELTGKKRVSRSCVVQSGELQLVDAYLYVSYASRQLQNTRFQCSNLKKAKRCNSVTKV